jgi:hypothetical protein
LENNIKLGLKWNRAELIWLRAGTATGSVKAVQTFGSRRRPGICWLPEKQSFARRTLLRQVSFLYQWILCNKWVTKFSVHRFVTLLILLYIYWLIGQCRQACGVCFIRLDAANRLDEQVYCNIPRGKSKQPITGLDRPHF